MNFTVTVPPNAQNHGDPGLLCLPPIWTDYFIFFATNYFAHAATLISQPGESLMETLISTANALFIPGSGALRAFRFLVLYISPLISGPRRADRLEQAARADALCMVVKEKDVNTVTKMKGTLELLFGEDIRTVPTTRAIHGVCRLPHPDPDPEFPRFRLIEVPPTMPLRDYDPRAEAHNMDPDIDNQELTPIDMQLAKSYNIPKILISILQIAWGIITLYKARGDQIALYGYGAFSLTVAPYAIMSLINLATNLLRPEYATMYLVHTTDLTLASDQSGEFAGIVASVDITEFDEKHFAGTLSPTIFFAINLVGYFIICILPIALVGGFTGFGTGSNINIAISWVLGWLIVGSVSALWVRVSATFWLHAIWEVLLVFPLWIPAIGGLVVVAQMLKDFGICTESNS
ncbi:hypothetical protein EG329_012389 [Mollisiaceae sp. DMI_Dod_QoI]|nr:hypothetical protein EG329_012389 [Helotiales sp. DMI_Dod_QoI]